MNLFNAQKLAVGLMADHGLFAGTAETRWSFHFDRSVRRFGCCKYRTRTITLSRKLVSLNDEVKVRDTILHEIAHALAGHAAGHGPAWRRKALEIGCNGERCYDSDTVSTPPRAFVGRCACGWTIQRHRRVRGLYHARCGVERGRIEWTRNAV